MNPILFLSLMILLAGALPWSPYSAYGRLRHHRPWDWLLDNPSWEDFRTFGTQTSAGTPVELGSTPQHREERVIKTRDDPWETDFATLQRQLEERWVVQATHPA